MSPYLKHCRRALVILFVFIIIGTIGYRILEGWPLLDSLYMSIITISTVGFNETHPLSPATRIFTIGLIVVSIAVVGYLVGSLTQILIVGEIATLFGRRRLENKINKLRNHIIVCGCGRVGAFICHQLKSIGIPLVVVESNPQALDKLDQDMLYIDKNAVDDDVLAEANIEHARGLVTTLPSDPDNVFITLSARSMNKEIFILSRASKDSSVKKLKAAGANEVVSPHRMGANRMVNLLTKPTVVDFIDYAMYKSELPLGFEEIRISEDSRYVNVNIGESDIRQRFDLIIVAIKKKSGEMTFNPQKETIIEPGDVLVVLGKTADVSYFNETVLKTFHTGEY